MKLFLLATLLTGSVAHAAPVASACRTQPLNPRCAVGFTGVASIGCFGCPGPRPGTATLTVVGAAFGSASASYTVVDPADATCVISGSATGSVTGAIDVNFTWLRVGATAVITTTGDIDGAGAAVFVVTSPVGNPCGGPVTAQVAGAIEGT
ncbi:MAG TPA: hypothetical protein VNQ77_07245 [Frankiaceae bacterium]|nr:hypothetical protein [Frankiaceae bacterium]